jgi:hypothetical protein
MLRAKYDHILQVCQKIRQYHELISPEYTCTISSQKNYNFRSVWLTFWPLLSIFRPLSLDIWFIFHLWHDEHTCYRINKGSDLKTYGTIQQNWIIFACVLSMIISYKCVKKLDSTMNLFHQSILALSRHKKIITSVQFELGTLCIWYSSCIVTVIVLSDSTNGENNMWTGKNDSVLLYCAISFQVRSFINSVTRMFEKSKSCVAVDTDGCCFNVSKTANTLGSLLSLNFLLMLLVAELIENVFWSASLRVWHTKTSSKS